MSPATNPDVGKREEREPSDRQRARFAYKAVSGFKGKDNAEQYETLAKNLGAQVLQNGLGQTIAFLMSKAKGNPDSVHGALLGQVTEWLIKERKVFATPVAGIMKTEQLMNVLLSASRSHWRRAENETVTLATWLKRFADALLAKPEQGQAGKRG